jgi:hypothetical protein
VFHVELRQFPHTARAFNLTRERVHAQILAPWVRGEFVRLDGEQFAPERAKLKIYEGPELQSVDMGMGRGWQNVMRTGEDVTERELNAAKAAPPVLPGPQPRAALADELAALCAAGPVSFPQALALASAAQPGARLSVRLAVAEAAIWELLSTGRAALVAAAGGEPLAEEQATAALLTPATWFATPATIMIEAQLSGR